MNKNEQMKTESFLISMPENIKQALKKYGKQNNKKISTVAREIILQFLFENKYITKNEFLIAKKMKQGGANWLKNATQAQKDEKGEQLRAAKTKNTVKISGTIHGSVVSSDVSGNVSIDNSQKKLRK